MNSPPAARPALQSNAAGSSALGKQQPAKLSASVKVVNPAWNGSHWIKRRVAEHYAATGRGVFVDAVTWVSVGKDEREPVRGPRQQMRLLDNDAGNQATRCRSLQWEREPSATNNGWHIFDEARRQDGDRSVAQRVARMDRPKEGGWASAKPNTGGKSTKTMPASFAQQSERLRVLRWRRYNVAVAEVNRSKLDSEIAAIEQSLREASLKKLPRPRPDLLFRPPTQRPSEVPIHSVIETTTGERIASGLSASAAYFLRDEKQRDAISRGLPIQYAVVVGEDRDPPTS